MSRRAQVEASSPAVRDAILDLLELATSYGVELHRALRVREAGGHMSVHADALDGEVLIRLPEDVLVPMGGAQWDTSGNDLVILHHDETATTAHKLLAEALLAVYNATGKAEWIRTELPMIALRGVGDVVEVIRSLRPGFARQPTSVAEAFLGTRVLRWSLGAAAGQADPRHFLMPVTDLVNHHAHGAPWRRIGGALSTAVARPTDDSQCFVQYRARRDPLDLALGYGFVDDSCTLARSIPVTVEVDGLGLVEVAGQHLSARSALDPPHVVIEPDRLWLSHMTFDTRHPNRLPGVLHMAVLAFMAKRSRTESDFARLTAVLIEVLLDHNQAVLEDARASLNRSTNEPAIETVALAIDEQRRLLGRFRNQFRRITQV